MRLCGVLWGLCAVAALSACAQNPQHQSTTFIDRYAEPNPTLTSFRECHGFNCRSTPRVSLNRQQWDTVAEVFRPRAKNAQAERRQIAQAVAVMRMQVGAQTGTAVHQWTHKDFQVLPNLSDPTQLDCIDESVNTWTYMTLMERAGLFHHHEVAKLSNAGSLSTPATRPC